MNMSVAPAFANSTMYSVAETVKHPDQRGNSPRTIRFPDLQAYLFGEISKELIVVQWLLLNIEQDEDQSYVVSDEIFLVYGSGNNQSDAIKDYIASLIEFYNILKASKTDPFDQKQFAHLQSYIHLKSKQGYDAVQAIRD